MKIVKTIEFEQVVQEFIKRANRYDVNGALSLFTDHAIIDDVSVGEKFKNRAGIKKYLEKFFVGYHTTTKLKTLDILNEKQVNAKVKFTGDFGHENGGLTITINDVGLITSIHAYLD